MKTAPILERERRGSNDASARVSKLFERHGRMVLGVCRAMLRDPHEAEDATQQAFLSAYKALLGGARVRDEGAWLATIARNECRARITAAMRAPLAVPDEDLAAIPALVDGVERSQQADALRAALDELPERQREAVVLRDLYGLRYAEVATALGLSRAATEALLFRARRTLKVRLRPALASAIAVPIAVQEGLAQAIPGFAASSAGATAVGVAGGGLIAKLTAGPVGVKVATAAVAVSTVGAVGTVDSERAARDRDARAEAGIVQTGGRGDDSGHRRGGGGEDDDARDEDRSGSGRDDGESSDDDSSRRSGSSRSGSDDSSGTGRSGTRETTTDEESVEPERSGPSASSGSGSSGSSDRDGSSGSGSSGSGSSGPIDDSGESGSGGGSGTEDPDD